MLTKSVKECRARYVETWLVPLLTRSVRVFIHTTSCARSWRENRHRYLYTKDDHASVASAATDHRVRRIEPFVKALESVFHARAEAMQSRGPFGNASS